MSSPSRRRRRENHAAMAASAGNDMSMASGGKEPRPPSRRRNANDWGSRRRTRIPSDTPALRRDKEQLIARAAGRPGASNDSPLEDAAFERSPIALGDLVEDTDIATQPKARKRFGGALSSPDRGILARGAQPALDIVFPKNRISYTILSRVRPQRAATAGGRDGFDLARNEIGAQTIENAYSGRHRRFRRPLQSGSCGGPERDPPASSRFVSASPPSFRFV